ncbi:MAG: efflux RND transporter periplasmic adaptor subunit [Anaerolineae bacterium]
MRRVVAALVVLVVIAAVAGGAWYIRANPDRAEEALTASGFKEPSLRAVGGSGYIEATRLAIASEVAGRITKIGATEGKSVTSGDVLVALDPALKDAEIAQAEAAVAAAQAQLARTRVGARPEDIRQAETLVAQAQAAQKTAEQIWRDAVVTRDNPQALDLKIAQAKADIDTAEDDLARATAAKDVAEQQKKDAEFGWESVTKGIDVEITLPNGQTKTRHVYPSDKYVRQAGTGVGLATDQWWSAWTTIEAAQARLAGVQEHLDNLQAMRANPVAAQAAVDTSAAQVETARAAVATAEAQLALAHAGPRDEAVRTAEANVAQVTAHLNTLRAERDRLTVRAPLGALVGEEVAHVGEAAQPGAPLLRLNDLSSVTLTVYVPESDLGHVAVGAAADVRVDAFPERVFKGNITFIAPEAEFTPKNVQTADKRTTLVFPVKIKLPNAEGLLKPGMPADAVFPDAPLVATASAADSDQLSGALEARTVSVASEVGGRVAEVLVGEGDRVTVGQPIVRLDSDLLNARIGEAKAAIAVAQARLAQAKAAPRPEDIAVAEAQLGQAEQRAQSDDTSLKSARVLLANPQDLDDQISQAQSAITTAQAGVGQAQANLHAAQVKRDGYADPSTERIAAQHAVDAAQAALDAAESRVAGAQSALAQLQAMRNNPVQAQAAVNRARAATEQAAAGVDVAQAGVERAKAEPLPEDIAVAEANVRQAEAALQGLLTQLDKLTLRSPVDGIVSSQDIHVGEIARPGAALLSLADLSQVTARVFVPEAQLGAISIGQPIQARVDAFPGRTFPGRVTLISPEAEFTPRNVQTAGNRAYLVFAVKSVIDNPDGALKPGMPVDVQFGGAVTPQK